MNPRAALLATLIGCDAQTEECAELLGQVAAYSEDMHRYDWEPFRDLPGTPSADLAYCERIAEDLGVRIDHERETTTGIALPSTIIFPVGYDDWPKRDQAGVLCHEVHLSAWANRVGSFAALAVWSSDAGRLAIQSASTAVSDDLFARYGESAEHATTRRAIIADLFPTTYRVDIDPSCVAKAMDWAQWEYWVWMSRGGWD